MEKDDLHLYCLYPKNQCFRDFNNRSKSLQATLSFKPSIQTRFLARSSSPFFAFHNVPKKIWKLRLQMPAAQNFFPQTVLIEAWCCLRLRLISFIYESADNWQFLISRICLSPYHQGLKPCLDSEYLYWDLFALGYSFIQISSLGQNKTEQVLKGNLNTNEFLTKGFEPATSGTIITSLPFKYNHKWYHPDPRAKTVLNV